MGYMNTDFPFDLAVLVLTIKKCDGAAEPRFHVGDPRPAFFLFSSYALKT